MPERVAPEPARRFVIERSWWIASELVRRHPDHLIYEMHPGGGMYDVLKVFRPPNHSGDKIMLNRAGTIQVHRQDWPSEQIATWAGAIAENDPHGVVKSIEQVAGLSSAKKAPPSTPRTLAFRFISSFLTAFLNDRTEWDARNGVLDTSGGGERRAYLASFPSAQEELRSVELEGWEFENPEAHFWALLADGEPRVLVSHKGRVHLREAVIDLKSAYVSHDRRMLPVVAEVSRLL